MMKQRIAQEIATCCLLTMLFSPFAEGLPAPQESSAETVQRTASPAETAQTSANVPRTDQLPDSPGTLLAQTSANQATSQNQSQTQAPEPLGTAAAGTPVVSGIAASQPAGAAIAPAKQRRVRTILIEVGAIVGAGVAIGTVAALSSASPSRPPGAR
jgi:hypothetical protein